ncbi:hypothetical protein V8C35DRAFT_310729 [Trichoderma chlorosporum]
MASVTPPLVPREVAFIPTEELMSMTTLQLRSLVMKSGFMEPRKGPWSPEESHRLIALVRLMGPQDWVSIASYMASRNAKQCRERYHQNLDPNLRHDPITEEEARLIMDLYARYGTAWARIAEQLPGRSDNAIKNYVNGLVNKTRRAEERQAGHHHAAGRRGSSMSIRSGASPSASTAVAVASASSSAVTALTPSPFGSQPLESPTFSEMTDPDGGNYNYTLSSTSPWGQHPMATPQTSPPALNRQLAQSQQYAPPVAPLPISYQQPTYETSPSGQNGHGYVQQHEVWRPASSSSEPWSYRNPTPHHHGMDLARYSISGPAFREQQPMEFEMQHVEPPRMQAFWTENGMPHTPLQPPHEQSAVAVSPGRQADPRMAIANLLG